MLTGNFTPAATRTDIVVAVGGTAVSVTLPAGDQNSFAAFNPTANMAYLAFGSSTVSATTSSPYFVPPGCYVIFGIPIDATTVSGIFASSGTGTITSVPGEGA